MTLPKTRINAINLVARAFEKWVANMHFRFLRIDSYGDANITISFEHCDHNDGAPFEGLGGTLAHAFPPTDERFLYDVEEQWSISVTPGSFHLEIAALHEIEHFHGLEHGSVLNAIIYPYIKFAISKGFD
ncbi:metalloendoproteinase 1-like [Herrania umbratica]|uniref:Metalloendoproteinase 1-like n=1 Tax=Herrania umbratica TaxID=108875 RepID=A0A6J1BDU4_9ROSI|nr:metalloendoproteinase 1-like [Herrania umbratica]